MGLSDGSLILLSTKDLTLSPIDKSKILAEELPIEIGAINESIYFLITFMGRIFIFDIETF